MKTKSAAATFALHAVKAAAANRTVLYTHGARYKKDTSTPLGPEGRAKLDAEIDKIIAKMAADVANAGLTDLDAD